MFRFEKLEVWQRAVDYADQVYECTRGFPQDELYGLTSQMRRGAISVSSNVAEGSGRSTDKEFARFVQVGYSSLLETVSQSHVAKRQTFLPQLSFEMLYSEAEQLARMLSGLRTSLLK